VASDETLRPIGIFAKGEHADKYPPLKAGEQVLRVLKQIALAASN